ncbi:hypothetical protein [Methylocystis parvus]|uniref:hypothetical protein n=1 Tax=Methylocystis parvus TaxID=134 RepID=UPI003C731F54
MPLQATDPGNTGELASQLVEIIKPLAVAIAAGGIGWLTARRKNEADARKSEAEASAALIDAEASAEKTAAEAHAIEADVILKAARQVAEMVQEQNRGLRSELEALRAAMRERDEMDKRRDERERQWIEREADLRDELTAAHAAIAELRAAHDERSQMVMDFLAPQTKAVGFPR